MPPLTVYQTPHAVSSSRIMSIPLARFTRHRFLLNVFACMSIVYQAGHAQIPSPLPPEARAAVNNGITALNAKGYELAVEYFHEALRKAPRSPEIYADLGLTESKMAARELRAICWYGAYLSANPTASTDVVEKVKAEMSRLLVINKSNLSNLITTVQDAASKLPNPDPNVYRVVLLWEQAGYIDVAIRTTNLIHDTSLQGELLMNIARAQASADDIAGAQRSYESALSKHEFQNDDYTGTQTELAEAQARAGDIAGALKTAYMFHVRPVDSKNRDYLIAGVQGGIAFEQTRKGDIAGALKTADLISAKFIWIRSSADASIAEAQIKAGDLTGAINTLAISHKYANMIEDGRLKTEALAAIGKAQAKVGNLQLARESWDAALNTADLMLKPDKEAGKNAQLYLDISLPMELVELCYLGEARIEGGDVVGGEKTWAHAIDIVRRYSRNQSFYLAQIAEGQAKGNAIVAARRTADLIQDPYEKEKALGQIAEAEARIEIDSVNPTLLSRFPNGSAN